VIVLMGGRTIRELLADLRWRWRSDEQDAEQRRRHEDDRHQLDLERGWRELERDFPTNGRIVRGLPAAPEPPELAPAKNEAVDQPTRD
jgi:hypothetical protein